MTCQNCRHVNTSWARTCGNCGQSLDHRAGASGSGPLDGNAAALPPVPTIDLQLERAEFDNPAQASTCAGCATRGNAAVMTEDDAQRTWHFKQLRQSLDGLAHAASNQPALFPDSVASADGLAFAYDHWSDLVRGAYGSELTREQTDALDAIDRKIATMWPGSPGM